MRPGRGEFYHPGERENPREWSRRAFLDLIEDMAPEVLARLNADVRPSYRASPPWRTDRTRESTALTKSKSRSGRGECRWEYMVENGFKSRSQRSDAPEPLTNICRSDGSWKELAGHVVKWSSVGEQAVANAGVTTWNLGFPVRIRAIGVRVSRSSNGRAESFADSCRHPTFGAGGGSGLSRWIRRRTT